MANAKYERARARARLALIAPAVDDVTAAYFDGQVEKVLLEASSATTSKVARRRMVSLIASEHLVHAALVPLQVVFSKTRAARDIWGVSVLLFRL